MRQPRKICAVNLNLLLSSSLRCSLCSLLPTLLSFTSDSHSSSALCVLSENGERDLLRKSAWVELKERERESVPWGRIRIFVPFLPQEASLLRFCYASNRNRRSSYFAFLSGSSPAVRACNKLTYEQSLKRSDALRFSIFFLFFWDVWINLIKKKKRKNLSQILFTLLIRFF